MMFFIIIAVAIATHLIPAGTYVRTIVDGHTVVDPQSFSYVESHPAQFLDVFLAIPRGMAKGVTLVVAALLIGGGLSCVQASGALNIGISHVIKKIGIRRGDLILILLFYVFALMGGFLGFIETSLPFMPIVISLALAFGYDSLVGIAIAYVGTVSGFMGGPANPFTVGISNTLAGLPTFFGFGLRMLIFAFLTTLCLSYILLYARRVRITPSKSLVSDIDTSDLVFKEEEFEAQAFTVRHMIILASFVLGIAVYVYGALELGWGFEYLGAMFVLTGVISGALTGLGVEGTVQTFLKGATGMLEASLILGMGFGVSWMFESAQILDTIGHYLSEPLNFLPPAACAVGVIIVIAIIGLFIPSGSIKALLTMPIILPIAHIIGIGTQTTVFAFQFGDGVSKFFTPLLGGLLLALEMGRVPFSKWMRFVMPLVTVIFALSVAFVVIAVYIGYR